MQQRVIVNKGKRFIVNCPSSEDVGPACEPGTLWMQSTDLKWYAVNLTGTSASNDLAFYINQTPLNWESVGGQDFGYQLLACVDNTCSYQVYLSGSAGDVTCSIAQTPWAHDQWNAKPYLLLTSLTDGYFYPVYARSGSIYLFPDPNGRVWMKSTNPPPEPEPPAGPTWGSFLFDTNPNAYISASASDDWAFGTGDFTIEWFQYQFQNSNPPNQRILEIKSWPATTIGISVESAGTYVWVNGDIALSYSPAPVRQWVHGAVTRESGVIRLFLNGIKVGEATNTDDINNIMDPLMIGCELDYVGDQTNFCGVLTNIRIVKGTALYTADFSVPTTPLSPVANTKLLLLANDDAKFVDGSPIGRDIFYTETTWGPYSPFNGTHPDVPDPSTSDDVVWAVQFGEGGWDRAEWHPNGEVWFDDNGFNFA